MNKLNKKGFTLVELLAVIIILAIVVGITIPAVLTTTSNAKKKAFQTAANTMADWIDRQYQVYTTGITTDGIATLDPTFESECINHQGKYIDSTGTEKNYTDTYTCDTSKRVTFVNKDFIIAAGLKIENVRTREDDDNSFTGIIGFDGENDSSTTFITSARYKNPSSAVTTFYRTQPTTSVYKYFYQEIYTMVSINPDTGRSCVRLVAKTGGDYPTLGVACGGVCTSTWDNSDNADNSAYCRTRKMY